MLTEQQALHYWRYAEVLNEQLGNTTRFVEPNKDNYNTYSLEFTSIILAAGSEVEVVCRLICEMIDSGNDYTSQKSRIKMKKILETILEKFPDIYKAKQYVLYQHEAIYPFQELKKGVQLLSWWDSYNNIKHRRYDCFSESTLINAINIVAALIILNSYLYEFAVGKHAPVMSGSGLFNNCYSYCAIAVLPNEKLPNM